MRQSQRPTKASEQRAVDEPPTPLPSFARPILMRLAVFSPSSVVKVSFIRSRKYG